MHLEELQANDARCARNETLLWKHHTEKFAELIKKKVFNSNSNSFSSVIFFTSCWIDEHVEIYVFWQYCLARCLMMNMLFDYWIVGLMNMSRFMYFDNNV